MEEFQLAKQYTVYSNKHNKFNRKNKNNNIIKNIIYLRVKEDEIDSGVIQQYFVAKSG